MDGAPGLREATAATTDKPEGLLPGIVVSVTYDTAPGEVARGSFEFRHPTLLDEQQIATRTAAYAAPTRVSDLSLEDQAFFRSVAAISVLCPKVPKWYDPNSPLVRRVLPMVVYEEFLAQRQGLFRSGGTDGQPAKDGPSVEVVSSVG